MTLLSLAARPTVFTVMILKVRDDESSSCWSDEIYAAWKDWIFPQGSILIDRGRQVSLCDIEQGAVVGFDFDCLSLNSVSPLIRRVKKDQEVSLLKVGVFYLNGSASALEYSYAAKVMCVFSRMSGALRRELDSFLMLSLRTQLRICDLYGMWLDDESGSLYLVSERKNGSVLALDDTFTNIIIQDQEDRVITSMDDRVSGLASVCPELFEILLGLQSEGFVCGCLGMSCLCLDEFGHVYIDLCEAVVTGKKLRKCMSTAVNMPVGVFMFPLLIVAEVDIDSRCWPGPRQGESSYTFEQRGY